MKAYSIVLMEDELDYVKNLLQKQADDSCDERDADIASNICRVISNGASALWDDPNYESYC